MTARNPTGAAVLRPEKTQAIVAAFYAELSERGFEGLSMDRVAGRAGCNQYSGTAWSNHSYGRAVDINTVQNPYISRSGVVSPPAGAPFTDRARTDPGVIHAGDAVVRAFARRGWSWGGDWTDRKDYQHFEKPVG